MTDIENAMALLAAADCHCASCAKTGTECPVREKLQRLPYVKGGLNECKTRGGGYVLNECHYALSELHYRYRDKVREREDEKRDRRYDAYRLAKTLLECSDDDTTLEIIGGELDYDPGRLHEDIIALARIAEAAL